MGYENKKPLDVVYEDHLPNGFLFNYRIARFADKAVEDLSDYLVENSMSAEGYRLQIGYDMYRKTMDDLWVMEQLTLDINVGRETNLRGEQLSASEREGHFIGGLVTIGTALMGEFLAPLKGTGAVESTIATESEQVIVKGILGQEFTASQINNLLTSSSDDVITIFRGLSGKEGEWGALFMAIQIKYLFYYPALSL